jgi:methyl-accepting chemotaxis protein
LWQDGIVASKTHGGRIDRLEQVVQILAEGQVSVEKLIAELATETRRGFDEVNEQFKKTDRHMQETDRRMRETDERMKRTDERIDKLVVAIRRIYQS